MSVLDFTSFEPPPEWMDRAACRGVSPELFFPEPGMTAVKARAVCAVCPVKASCLAWAFEASAAHGVFGGLTGRQRARMRKPGPFACPGCARRFDSTMGVSIHLRSCKRPPAPHGERSRYGNGCRCQKCRAAHAEYERTRRSAKRAAA